MRVLTEPKNSLSLASCRPELLVRTFMRCSLSPFLGGLTTSSSGVRALHGNRCPMWASHSSRSTQDMQGQLGRCHQGLPRAPEEAILGPNHGVGLVVCRFPFPMVFSSCSKKDLETSLEKGMGMCLFNLPEVKQPFGGRKCGNGYVEDGEQCDCGELEVSKLPPTWSPCPWLGEAART